MDERMGGDTIYNAQFDGDCRQSIGWLFPVIISRLSRYVTRQCIKMYLTLYIFVKSNLFFMQ